MIINKLKITFPSKSINEALARNIIASFCIPINPTLEELSDIKTAVSEAVTNCIVHAYDGKDGNIEMEANLYDNGAIGVEIKDFGVGIDDIDRATQPFFTTKTDGDRSGMGFTVMQTFMDSVNVTSKKGEGTTVHMSKILKNGAKNARP